MFLKHAKFFINILSIFLFSLYFSHNSTNQCCKNFILAPNVSVNPASFQFFIIFELNGSGNLVQKIQDITQPQTSTYADSLHQNKYIYNHISQNYVKNIHKIQTYLNLQPRSTTTTNKTQDYITQKLQGYNKLIAQPKTNSNLVKTCYNYGLLNTVYTYDGEELAGIPEIHRALLTYKRVTKGTLFYVKFYTAPAEILYNGRNNKQRN